jgi:hypothetical protein
VLQPKRDKTRRSRPQDVFLTNGYRASSALVETLFKEGGTALKSISDETPIVATADGGIY